MLPRHARFTVNGHCLRWLREVVCKRNLRSCTVGFGPTDIEVSLARQPLLLPLNHSTSTHVNLYRNADHGQFHCVIHCVKLR